MMNSTMKPLAMSMLLAMAGPALAFTFQGESVSGSFDSTISVGIGIRAEGPACNLVLKGSPSAGAPGGCTEAISGLGDQGNLNYGRGDTFTNYLKGTHELLLKMPEDVKFMARVSWLKDFAAPHTSGYVSGGNPPGVGSLTDDAKEDLSFKA
ncbi:DUF1302 domain-containing protein, partial [Zoogloea sp. G-4-1-14]|nr:DUF1302 domain-containing protein [Zoogloea dura]